jgi:hypothetical protein
VEKAAPGHVVEQHLQVEMRGQLRDGDAPHELFAEGEKAL